MKFIFVLLVMIFSINLFGQNSKTDEMTIDSLKRIIDHSKVDSIRVIALTNWNAIIDINNPSLGLELNKRIEQICLKNLNSKLNKNEKIFFSKKISDAYNSMGIYFTETGQFEESEKYFFESIKIAKSIKYELSLSNAYANLGNLYDYKSDFDKSLDYYYRSLKSKKKLKDTNGINILMNNIAGNYYTKGEILKSIDIFNSTLESQIKMKDTLNIIISYLNLGVVYIEQEYFDKSIANLNKALGLSNTIKYEQGIANAYQNLGVVYIGLNKFEKSLVYLFKALEIFERLDSKQGIVLSMINIGENLKHLHKLDSAMIYFDKSLDLSLEMNDQNSIGSIYISIGELHKEMNNDESAIQFIEKGLEIVKNLELLTELQRASFALYTLYSERKYYEKALKMYELYHETSEKLKGDEVKKQLLKIDLESKFLKERIEDSLINVKERELKDSELAKQEIKLNAKKNQQYLLFGGLTLILIFTFFLYKRFKLTQKQKLIIEQKEKETLLQKFLIEEKHKEITDSINYAERIQRSFLAAKNMLNDNLNEYFILFQPKDVVSGDFYWTDKLSNGNFLIAAADSTGHGVPGAIMSILNITSLENAVKEGALNPAEILNHTRINIIERLKKDGSAEGGKDGMDCALLSFDFQNNKLNFALANNPLWIIRNNELIEYPADKMPVGKHDRDSVPFTQQEIDLQKGDLIFIFTDGYADQFGGEKGKKFKYSNLQKLLLENANLDLETPALSWAEGLNLKLQTAFSQWKGDLEQVDDVCIIGIRI